MHRRFVGLGAIWLAVGCGGATPPHGTTGEGAELADERRASLSETRAPRPEEGAPSSSEKPTATSEKPTAVRVGQPLPVDPAFVRAELPPADVARYVSFREVQRIDVGQSHLQQIDRLGPSRVVAISSDEARLRVYDRGRLVGNHGLPGAVRFETGRIVAWPEGEDRALLGGNSGLHLLDVTSGEVMRKYREIPFHDLRFTADRRFVGALSGANESSSLVFFERRGESDLVELFDVPFEERVDAWDVTRDGKLLAVLLYPSDEVRVIELGRGELFRVRAPRYGGDIAFSPDGRHLAIGGDGLLVVDLVRPERRAFYSYVQNNVGHVRFSPSGDVVAASSYDGQIRLFALERKDTGLALGLVTTLRHAGRANVYEFFFSPDGASLTSASGDRTIRTFSASAGRKSSVGVELPRFHDLATWAELDPAGAAPLASPREPTFVDGRYAPPAFTAPARPSRIAPGHYACRITTIYKMRDCFVRKDAAGRTLLEFATGNLLGITGVLYDDGPVVRYEARLDEKNSVIDCPGCEKQPLQGILRGSGKSFRGLLTFRTYYDPHVPPPLPPVDARVEEANDRFPFELVYRGPLEGDTSGGEQQSPNGRIIGD